ncbi:MAG: outer membrane lipid asymmetry maintenance protein MlaD [Alphaproteobacteria bacterium HGW-Alphaproteobacteria-6]|nr:MAG: outer membrane lipid asymmetry maintenance protein MlaD [Alphaproteobacteria bacterium HGW-Alphaproteobacteria-6]
MSESRTEVAIGAGVLAVALGFLVYAGQGSGIGGRSGSYELTAAFRSVEGITTGTDVRLAGVKVGTVTALALNPTNFFADAKVAIRDGIVLPDDSTIVIASEGLLGGSFVEILPGGSPDNLGPGDEIENTQGAVSVIALLMKFVGASSGDETSGAATE